MGVEFSVGCPARRDRFELGKGSWGWHYTDDPDEQPRRDPSIERLLVDGLHRDDREAFAEYVLRVWLCGYVEAGCEPHIRDVGYRLFDYCADRDWDVLLIPEECDAHPDWYDWSIVDSKYKLPAPALECNVCGTRPVDWDLMKGTERAGDQCPCCYLDDYDCDGTLVAARGSDRVKDTESALPKTDSASMWVGALVKRDKDGRVGTCERVSVDGAYLLVMGVWSNGEAMKEKAAALTLFDAAHLESELRRLARVTAHRDAIALTLERLRGDIGAAFRRAAVPEPDAILEDMVGTEDMVGAEKNE